MLNNILKKSTSEYIGGEENTEKRSLRVMVIACGVLRRYIYKFLQDTPHVADVTFVEMRKHIEPDKLRAELQQLIDDISERDSELYDYIILGFGLCGNATLGLKAGKIPIVIPRAHDCCTFFMGSKQAFEDEFGDDRSAEWCSDGYFEGSRSIHAGELTKETNDSLGYGKTYEEYVEEYGEENAAYLFEMLGGNASAGEGDESKTLRYIKNEETAHLGYRELIRRQAETEGVNIREIDGDMTLIRNLCFGNWANKDFLVLQPGEHVVGVYDHEEIIRAGK